MDRSPKVSIIIPTYNSGQTIEKCLKSIKDQTYKNIEIIVIDKFSKDKTVSICKKYTNKILFDSGNRVSAKNVGIRHSKGGYLCFIDSDMLLTPNVIYECVKSIRKSRKGGAVIIPETSIGSSFWVKVRDFERSFYISTLVESPRFFKKELVTKVKGHDEDIIIFEESVLPQKIEDLGFNVNLRIRPKIMHMEYGFSMIKWLKKKYYYGKTASIYQRKYKKVAKHQLSISYRAGLFLKNKKFYSKPVLASGVIVLKILEGFSIELGSLSEIISKPSNYIRNSSG